jgi:AraC-like DNA-binding protein
MMEFQFTAHKGFHFATAFAEFLQVPAAGNSLVLPPFLGNGFIREVYLEDGLSLCIHQYILYQPFTLRRLEDETSDILTLKFDATQQQRLSFGDGGAAVEIGTSNLFAELRLSPGHAINFLVVTTTRQTLLELLRLDLSGNALETMLKNSRSFVLHENLTLEMDRTLKQLCQIDDTTALAHLLYQTKVRELTWLLFTKLLTRPVNPVLPIHQADAEKIYMIHTQILADLGTPPLLPGLARSIGMSETKMKHLFRQIFGDSIYNYYQSARMDAAADLLRKMSVSETGYELGFTNMSHFSRLFEKHHNIKPKKFKDTISH